MTHETKLSVILAFLYAKDATLVDAGRELLEAMWKAGVKGYQIDLIYTYITGETFDLANKPKPADSAEFTERLKQYVYGSRVSSPLQSDGTKD